MTHLRFGLRMPPCTRIDAVADFAAAAEQAGIDTAWFPDSQFLWRDVWATIALAAERTERIRLGTAVTNFETRNPAVTAAATATVEELAPGRVVLGVATGDSAVKTLGLPPTRLARLREEIGRVRTLLAGHAVVYEGAAGPYSGRAMRVRAAPGRPIPIFVAATGPKALALAGEIADGVIVLSGSAPDLVERALGDVRRGLERVGRSASQLEICLAAHTAVVADEEEAARLVKPLVVTSAQLGGSEALRAAGIEVTVPPVVPGVYPDVTHAEDWEAAIAAADAYVSDEAARRYAETFALAGTADSIAERLERAAALGVTSVYLLGLSSYELPSELLTALREVILPRFGAGSTSSSSP
jgi:5,10-methylenetetrahydromethanopterin reductase